MKKTMKKVLCVVMCLALLLATGIVSAFAESDNVISRVSCTINGDTKTQRGFCWYTTEESESQIKISLNGEDVTDTLTVYEKMNEEWEGNYVHQLTVSGLTAGSEYTYQVGDGENWSKEGKFTTDDGDQKVNFISIGDVQASSFENFERASYVLDAAFETVPNADFVANMGDFTNDSTNEEWDNYFANFERHNMATSLAPTAGNHDGLGVWHWFENIFNLDESEAVQTLNGVNYSFDYGNAHFAVLNTNDLLCVTLAQMQWLKNDMNKSAADWKIVFMHKSPYTLGKDGKWPDALYLSDVLVKIIDECDVDLVMSGHDHMYLRTKPLADNKVTDGGATYVLGGTAGTKRYEVREFSADLYMKTKFIDAMTIQKGGYGNQWNGKDWNDTDESNVGGVFDAISIDGGNLTLKAYVLSEDTMTTKLIDTLTLTKETGKAKPSFSGDNSTSVFDYALTVIPSFLNLAKYTFINWLPKTLIFLPKIIYYVIKTDTF